MQAGLFLQEWDTVGVNHALGVAFLGYFSPLLHMELMLVLELGYQPPGLIVVSGTTVQTILGPILSAQELKQPAHAMQVMWVLVAGTAPGKTFLQVSSYSPLPTGRA